MGQRERLIELLLGVGFTGDHVIAAAIADSLLANGVVVLPCRCRGCVYRDDPDVCPVFSVWTLDINDNFFCGLAKRKGGE